MIGGHSGGVIAAMRAAGIDAADAGLASSEAFEASSKRRPKTPKDPNKKQNGGPSSRAYLEVLGRSFAAGRIKEIRSVAAARDLVSVPLALPPFHRWRRLPGQSERAQPPGPHHRSPSHQRIAGEHATQ